MRIFSLAVFKTSSLSLILDSFIIICLRDHFELEFWGDLLASQTWMSKSLCGFGKSAAIIS